MSISSDNLPYFQYIVKNNFPVGDFQNAVFLVLNDATDENDAILKLNSIAGRNIFVTPTPSSALQNSINTAAPPTDNSPDLTTTILGIEYNVTNLQAMLSNIQNSLATRDAYFKPFTGIAQNCNNSNIPFTLMNTSIIAQSYGTELSFYQALRTCKINAMNSNANHYLPMKAADGTINCVELSPSDFANQCELLLNGDVAGYGASAPIGTMTVTVAGALTGTAIATVTRSAEFKQTNTANGKSATYQQTQVTQYYLDATTAINGIAVTTPVNGAVTVPVTMTWTITGAYSQKVTDNPGNIISYSSYLWPTEVRTAAVQMILPAPEAVPMTVPAPTTVTVPTTTMEPVTLAEKVEVEVVAQIATQVAAQAAKVMQTPGTNLILLLPPPAGIEISMVPGSASVDITGVEVLMTGVVTVSYE